MRDTLYSDNWSPTEVIEAKKLIGPILILGASGFIGAKLFFSLSQHRDDVLGCSRDIKNNWRFKNSPHKNLENIDITDPEKLRTLVKMLKPKTIFNLTAYGGHSYQTDAQQIHLVNYTGTLNILRVLPDIDCRAFVQAGSSSEYGLNSAAPLEDDELRPNSDYAVSKIGASYLVKYYGQVAGLPTVHLRLYSIYGPWEDRRRLMPILVSSCLNGQWPKLVERDVSHDFVYVDDCTNAFVKAALYLYGKQNFGESVNIATGLKTTMEDLAEKAKIIFDITHNPQFGSIENKKWDIKNWYGNPELAHKILRWQHHTSLEDGLRLLANWEKEFKKTA